MIDSFRDEYSFLSNYSASPFTDECGDFYPTMEHYFQAQKATNSYDFELVRKAKTPGLAKRYGRQIKIAPDWESVKVEVMRKGLHFKFAIPELRDKLLATGVQYLEEGNFWHDNTWGNCQCPRCKDIMGKNMLGQLLMQVREEIKNNV